MDKLTWILDEKLLDRHDDCGFPRLDDAVKEAGHEIIISRQLAITDIPAFSGQNPDFDEHIKFMNHLSGELKFSIICGTVRFCNQILNSPIKYIPGAYLKKHNLKYSTAAAHYGNLMLNERFILLPYGELRRRILEDLVDGLNPPHFKHHSLFVRPDNVTKEFAGRIHNFLNPEDNIDELGKYQPINDEEIVVIAEDKSDYILAEFRHVIVNRKLITSSQYRRDDRVDIRTDCEPDCEKLAEWVAKHEWQPDYVYVVDTCLTLDGPKIIELNSFSCAGLYGCNTREIVKAVSEAAWLEYTGEIDQ